MVERPAGSCWSPMRRSSATGVRQRAALDEVDPLVTMSPPGALAAALADADVAVEEVTLIVTVTYNPAVDQTIQFDEQMAPERAAGQPSAFDAGGLGSLSSSSPRTAAFDGTARWVHGVVHQRDAARRRRRSCVA